MHRPDFRRKQVRFYDNRVANPCMLMQSVKQSIHRYAVKIHLYSTAQASLSINEVI